MNATVEEESVLSAEQLLSGGVFVVSPDLRLLVTY